MQTNYYYRIYGFLVKTNVKMPLPEIESSNTYDLSVSVEYAGLGLVHDRIKIKEIDNKFVVDIRNLVKYEIDALENKISCIAKDFQHFFSTLFNTPFSIYLAARKEVLLHCCSMLYDNRLICFLGKKGIGKSTTTFILDGDKFKLYSDDTLRVTKNNVGFRAHNYMKLTMETIDKLNVKNLTGEKNIAGKPYIKIQQKEKNVSVEAAVLLRRGKSEVSTIKARGMQLKSIYCNNIVGIHNFPSVLLRQSIANCQKINIPIFILSLPDNLERLLLSKSTIEDSIKELLSLKDAIHYPMKG